MWVAGQMGHVDTEMVMKIYGKWIPDTWVKRGYQPINNWDHFIEPINPQGTFQMEEYEFSSLISNCYMVEAAGVEPAFGKKAPCNHTVAETTKNHNYSNCYA